MAATRHTAWQRHLDAIGDELVHLSIACDVQLREPGVVERIIKNDETVCGTRNPIGFKKLRSLVMATFNSINKAIDRIGPEDVKMLTDELAARLDKISARGKT